jgi:hypothetical protein
MKNTDLKKYQEAFRNLERQEEKKERQKFKKNLILFVIIIPILICLDFLMEGNHFHWSLLPLFGWGSGLIAWLVTLPKVDKTLPIKEKEAEKLAGLTN